MSSPTSLWNGCGREREVCIFFFFCFGFLFSVFSLAFFSSSSLRVWIALTTSLGLCLFLSLLYSHPLFLPLPYLFSQFPNLHPPFLHSHPLPLTRFIIPLLFNFPLPHPDLFSHSCLTSPISYSHSYSPTPYSPTFFTSLLFNSLPLTLTHSPIPTLPYPSV